MAIKLDPHTIGAPLGALYKIWCRTLRYKATNVQQIQSLQKQGKLLIAAVWHNELFSLPWFAYKKGFHCTTIVSQSKDGEFLAQILQRLGFSTARGSSRRGGLQALRNARKIMLEEKRACVITVDGPKGPRHKAKEGAFYLAQKTGASVLPIRVFTPRAFVFTKAWDRFRLPYPFSFCEINLGEPYEVTKEKLTPDVLEREKLRLEGKMQELGKIFDTL